MKTRCGSLGENSPQEAVDIRTEAGELVHELSSMHIMRLN